MTLLKNSHATMQSHLWNMNFHLLFLFYISILSLTSFSSNSASPSKASYSDLCAAFVAEPTREPLIGDSTPSVLRLPGYYVAAAAKPGVTGAPPLLELSNYTLSLNLVYLNETHGQELLNVEAKFILFTRRAYVRTVSSSSSQYSESIYQFRPVKSNRMNSLVFNLKGFWSKSQGKLCVVGEGNYRSRDSFSIPAFLKLNGLYNSANITTLVTGTLESLVGFDPISIILFPRLNYDHTLLSQELVDGISTTSGSESKVGLGFDRDPMISQLCTTIFFRPLSLKYKSHCTSNSSGDKCSPLKDFQGQLPNVVTLTDIDCFETRPRVRLLIKFSMSSGEMWNHLTLDPKTTLVGEGVWDSKKRELFVVACRFVYTTGSWAETRVSECSTRLSLRFPEIWTIGNTNSIVGRLWSAETVKDSGYFDEIRFQSSVGSVNAIYEYTKIDEVKEWCPKKEPAKGEKFPDAFSYDMRFDIIGERDESHIARGYAQPISVGNRLYEMGWDKKGFQNYPTNMSYLINLFNVSWQSNSIFDISAEGIYDVSTGSLCMIGCRNIGLNSSDLSSNDDTFDCDILINFQFPPRDSKLDAGFINGSIESKRKKSDPLHFGRLELSSASYVAYKVQDSVQWMDWEIVLALISNTLACVFAALQIFHLRRNPNFLPFVSFVMLLILTLGSTIALAMGMTSLLMASFESQDVLLRSNGWLEATAVSEGVTALMLFLLQARLLQLTLSARWSLENQHLLWIAENKALIVCILLNCQGPVIAVLKRNRNLVDLSSLLITSYSENSIREFLKSYASLLLDSFLLPQILLNMFRDSNEKTLSCSFYIGTTFVRLLHHAFGLYRAQKSGLELVSTVWDVIIPFTTLLFAVVIYLQQKFGGRCIFSFRFRKSNVLETET